MDGTSFSGTIHASQLGALIQELIGHEDLQVTAFCTLDNTKLTKAPTKTQRKYARVPCKIDIDVCGPFDFFEDIGAWLEESDVYLQDPRVLARDVKYCNPHLLSFSTLDKSPMVSQVIAQVSKTVYLRDIVGGDDFLDNYFSSEVQLEETEQPRCIVTTMKMHQKQALTFMLRREEGWSMKGPHKDIWTIRDIGQERLFVNTISQVGYREPPQELYGGIIADPMGLGKTLTMIALVTTDLDTNKSDFRDQDLEPSSRRCIVPATLIIVPPAPHIIRNETSQRSKAICALDARCRWAVTGTPIQNHLNDLATLLKFIRAYPYHEKGRFEEDITRPLKEEVPGQEGVARLQRLSSCLLLRRPKRTVPLPERHDKECPIDFTPLEKETYDELKNRAVMGIENALKQSSGMSRSGAYVNMLQQIEALRLFCNLGLHYGTRHEAMPPMTGLSPPGVSDWGLVAQKTFNYCLEMGPVYCSTCPSSHSSADVEYLFDEGIQQKRPLFSQCLRYVCAECASNQSREGRACQCDSGPTCPVVSVSYTPEDIPEIAPEPKMLPNSFPSKVVALVTDIQAQPPGVKCIVFSSWRLTLNVVEAGLKQASIPCLRFDGKVPQNERQTVLDRFKKDPSIRVLLLTLACGNVGLTLTEASRAYLMEPHWNPTVEEQAFGRIHRMGQAREVTTVRFFIRDSFEERVMEVQESKKDLAGLFLSPHDGSHSSSSRSGTERLLQVRKFVDCEL
ncbi:related to global transactivator [Cephalotrichum gorgonifer]|uniref:Related to global transactivator n=1 Tax=Cephalotrichum gorgonifer TaxID=2041049 RepID=A0AAE8ST99_9PEZI|nr:related to global transactivator [Cephalotrichum gorgonifer]